VRSATSKVLSAKIRIGWDRTSINAVEVGHAIEAAGADYMVVHGRCRSDTYQTPVDLEEIARLKSAVSIPVIGNGNLFSHRDAEAMQAVCGLDGLMVSRGALGNPWVFTSIKEGRSVLPTPEEWMQTVSEHVEWQRETYGKEPRAAVCMRKHMLWYTKGWPGAKKVREQMAVMHSLDDICRLLEGFYQSLVAAGIERRDPPYGETGAASGRFSWDPKFDMDRRLDRGAPIPHYDGAPTSVVVGSQDYI
jgi:tRNA-dihydrouridine synthase